MQRKDQAEVKMHFSGLRVCGSVALWFGVAASNGGFS